jgi:hypothetical protein
VSGIDVPSATRVIAARTSTQPSKHFISRNLSYLSLLLMAGPTLTWLHPPEFYQKEAFFITFGNRSNQRRVQTLYNPNKIIKQLRATSRREPLLLTTPKFKTLLSMNKWKA